MSKKFQIIVSIFLVIIFVGIGVLWKESIRNRKKALKNASAIEYIQKESQKNLKLQNAIERLYALSRDLALERDPRKSSRKACEFLTEESSNRQEVAKSYHCLSELELESNSLESDLAAIKYSSLALEADFDEEFALHLAKIIIGPDAQEVRKIFAQNDYGDRAENFVSRNKSDEIKLLELLSQSNIVALKARAEYRLSYIHKLGIRGSNLIKAFEHQKKVLELTKIKPSKQTRVAFVFNDKYSPYALTTIASILLSSDLGNKYNFYVVMDKDDPILEASIEKIEHLKKIRNFDIEYITMPKDVIERNKKIFDFAIERFPKVVFFNLYLHEVFKNFDSMIFLDVDIIVNRDLHALQEKYLGMKNSLMAGAVDPLSANLTKNRSPDCYFNDVSKYLNTGVLVLNLKKMRESNFSQRMLNDFFKGTCNPPKFADQDVLNSVLSKSTLSDRWNNAAACYDWIPTSHIQFMPFIKHYMGNSKPWGKWVEKLEPLAQNPDEKLDDVILWQKHQKLVDYILNHEE